MTTTKLTREQLYALVWTTPIRTLAARFGTYDVALSQICKRHNIPRPPVGYWAQREVGKAPPTPPLPEVAEQWLQNIEIRAQPRPVQAAAESIEFDADVVELLERARSLPKIEVASALPRKLHPLLTKARDRLAESRVDDDGMVSSSHYQETNVEIWVTKASVRRSLLFMDALFKGIERLGGEIRIEKLRDWGRVTTVVRLAGERVTSLRLRERYKQVKEPPDPKRSWSLSEHQARTDGTPRARPRSFVQR